MPRCRASMSQDNLLRRSDLGEVGNPNLLPEFLETENKFFTRGDGGLPEMS